MCNQLFIRGMKEQSLEPKPVSHSVNLPIDVGKALEWRVNVCWDLSSSLASWVDQGWDVLLGRVQNAWTPPGYRKAQLMTYIFVARRKLLFSISLHHPHSTTWLRDPTAWQQQQCGKPAYSKGCEKCFGFVCLLESIRVFSLLKFWLCLSFSSSLSTWESNF